MKKPLGIKVIITFNLLSGLATLVVAAVMIGFTYDSEDLTPFFITIIPMLLIALVYFVATYGLWSIKKWGPSFSKWIYLLGTFISLILLVKPLLFSDTIELEDIFENILSLLITIAIVRYLSRKSIKEMYQKQNTSLT